MSDTCGGACCAVFPQHNNLEWIRTQAREGAYIADMLVPLTHDEAQARYALLGYGELSAAVLGSVQLATCRHWDETTRLCLAYEQRPSMCSDYPYGSACGRQGCEEQAHLVSR